MEVELSAKDRRQAQEFRFARWVVNKWYIVLALAILLPIVCGVIVAVTGTIKFTSQSQYEYMVRGDPRVRQYLALDAATEKLSLGDELEGERRNSASEFKLVLFFRAKDGNALSAKNLNRQLEIEKLVREFPGYRENFCWRDENQVVCEGEQRDCALPSSLLVQLPQLFGRTTSTPQGEVICGYSQKTSVTEADVERAVEEIMVDGEVSPDYAAQLGSDLSGSDRETAYIRSSFPIGLPLAGYDSIEDREEEQREKIDEWSKELSAAVEEATGEQFEVLVFSPSLYSARLGDLSFSDFKWIALSLAFVLLYMCIHTRSIYLGLMGILQIALAFPLTYFIYRLVFQVKIFTNLHLLAIFLILGIGADDVFVFTDAWVQAGGVLGEEVNLITRMAWTYRRAAKAMLITSFTTAMAFYVTATNNLIPISAFGVWAGSLILFQYLLCIVMFPCNLVVWQRHFRYRLWRKCLKKVDPFTGETAGSKAEEDAEGRHMDAVAHNEVIDRHGSTKFCFFIPISTREDPYAAKEGGTIDFAGTRPLEMFYHSNWLRFIARFRYILLGLGAVVFGLAIWGATLLKPLEGTEQWIPDSHPAQRPIVWDRDFFGSGNTGGNALTVTVVAGLDGVDQSDVAKWDPSEIGEAEFDEDFDLRPGANREALADLCRRIQSNETLSRGGTESVTCWISEFQEFLGEDRGKDFASHEELTQQVGAFLAFSPDGQSRPNFSYRRNIAISEDRIVFTTLSFVTPDESELGFELMRPITEKWERTIADYNQGAPAGVNDVYATTIDWAFAVTSEDLVSSAVRGLGISLAVAFVAMTLSTLNVVISLYAIFIVGAIVTCVIALMYLYGWGWGISESVAVVLIVGFSVDYVVHLANAYVESKNTMRYRRSRDAITEMGISIVAGAITSFGSGVFLIFGVVIFFDKFGIVMMTTIALSLIWSTVWFMAIVVTVGPQNKVGSLEAPIRWVLRKLCCCGFAQSWLADDGDDSDVREPTKRVDLTSSDEPGASTSVSQEEELQI